VNLYSAFIVVPHTQGAQVQITQCYLQITPYLPLPRKRSPDGGSPEWGCGHLIALLLIYLPRKDKRLSRPSWLTYSRRFTHISGQPSAAGRAQDSKSSPVKDWDSTTLPRNHSRRILSYFNKQILDWIGVCLWEHARMNETGVNHCYSVKMLYVFVYCKFRVNWKYRTRCQGWKMQDQKCRTGKWRTNAAFELQYIVSHLVFTCSYRCCSYSYTKPRTFRILFTELAYIITWQKKSSEIIQMDNYHYGNGQYPGHVSVYTVNWLCLNGLVAFHSSNMCHPDGSHYTLIMCVTRQTDRGVTCTTAVTFCVCSVLTVSNLKGLPATYASQIRKCRPFRSSALSFLGAKSTQREL